MTVVGRNILKSFFTPGSIPTSVQFSTLIDSAVNITEDRGLLGLRTYDPALIYVAGDAVIFDDIIYRANVTTVPGPFAPGNWTKIAGGIPGSVIYKGTWDAESNDPDLDAIEKHTGDYYVVSVAGNTTLNTPPNEISDWEVGDWAIYNGTLWEKIDNSDAVTDAANVAGAGAGLYKGKDLTILEFKRITTANGSLTLSDGTDAVDLSIQFDDAGTAGNRTWSASKISTELNGKQPLLDYTAEDEANKIIAFSGAPDDTEYPSAKLVYDQLALKQNNLGYTAENTANKVTAFQPTPDNIHYPSEKLVADQLALKQNNLGYTAENTGNKVTAFQPTPDNIHYPSEKLVADQLALKQNNLGYTAENTANKVTVFQPTPDNIHYPSEKLVADQLALKQNNLGYTAENTANKVTAFQPTPDNIHYPSEKLVADQLALKQNNLGYTPENTANKVTVFQATPDNNHYPSEKLVADKFATLSNVQNIKVNYTATSNPAVSNDTTQGYAAGSTWINTANQKEFVCVNAAAGAAVWKETTAAATVFGNDYTAVESTQGTSTSSTTFQTYSQGTTPPLKISTGTLAGTYRLQWSCLASNNGALGEYRLADITGTAAAVGQTQIFQAANSSTRTMLTGTVNIVLTGTNKDYAIQFRAQSILLNTQTLYYGRMELFRIS